MPKKKPRGHNIGGSSKQKRRKEKKGTKLDGKATGDKLTLKKIDKK